MPQSEVTTPIPTKKELDITRNINKNIAKKQRLYSRLQQVFDISNKIESYPSLKDVFLLRASEITSLRESFESICLEIFEMQLTLDPETQFSDSDLISFDDLFFHVKLCASKHAPKMADIPPCGHVDTKDKKVDIRPRLPKLELFTFDGNIENFTTFYETFCSLVHHQTGISSIDKFHYLLSCTKGAALSIVKSVPITSSNYDVVWQSLLDKYQDNRMLVGKYLDKMLNFPALKLESPASLNEFIEIFDHSYRAINALNIEHLSSYVLCHIALKGLDPNTRKTFEQSIDQKTIPTYDQLMSHVHNQIKILEHSQSHSGSVIPQSRNPTPNTFNKKSSETLNRKTFSSQTQANNKPRSFDCAHCGQNHMIFRCEQFRELSPAQRVSRADYLKLCHNCLKQNHSSADCQSEFKCFTCNLRHHALLHLDYKGNSATRAIPAHNASVDPEAIGTQTLHAKTSHSSSVNNMKNCMVLLGTAMVNVLDSFGNLQACRVLIDSGAQSNFITLNCLERLGLSRQKCPFNIFGLAGNSVKTFGMTSCTIKPRHSNNPTFKIDAIVLQRMTSDLPTVEISKDVSIHYKNLLLADPYFYKKSPVDIILAGDIFPEIFDGNKIIVSPTLPTALSSVFGFVLCGKIEVPCTSDDVTNIATSCNLVSYTSDSDTIDSRLKSFWEIEESPCDNPISPADKLAEEIYSERHYRDDCGRYVSPILMNPNCASLGESYNHAVRRLHHLERRFARSPELHAPYVDFMREYERLGHMQQYVGTEPSKYIIPHHCVVKTSSTTTPMRVVFDGSAATSNGVSLNDTLLIGRKLHHDILKIIFNFRLYDICFTADIAKFYRMVFIHPTERCYQHILWRESPSDEIKTYELLTNTYGLRSSGFVAVRTLQQLASDEGMLYPQAADILMQGFFVDDLLWSTQNLTEACTLQDELVSLLKLGGFDLRKWASNSPELLSRIGADQAVAINFSDDTVCPSLKVLGLKWLPGDDCFSFDYNMSDSTYTKRSVLKLLASIFDPVGFLSPCTFLAKCIMQDLWKLNLGWDDPLPNDLREKWTIFITSLSSLSTIKIERHMLIPQFCGVHLIAFCDASARGYAACIYVRSVDPNNGVKTRLLISKSKVAPIKPFSIPRLELMATVLLSKLILFVQKNIKNLNFQVTALTDSSVVLAWLQTPPYKLKTFVSSRVAQVVEVVSSNSWYHVRSENNAADVCSRGTMPTQLAADYELWLHGPAWLSDDVHQWPISIFYVSEKTDILELKTKVDTFSCPSQNKQNDFSKTFFENYSSFNKLQRIVAWCFRFAKNCKSSKNERSVGPISTHELNASHDAIIKITQNTYFSDEIARVQNCKFVSSLRKLSPFVDTHGFLRVGGRISQADLPYNNKHPLLLPKRCHITTLLIEHVHKVYLHVGPRCLQGILCKRYWIVSARSVIRSVLSKCITCFKCNPISIQPYMGTLPAERLKPNKVFDHVGCDLGGPFYIKASLNRNAKIQKCYMCLFVCFSTKAVHIEVLSDLSADCFLATLDRFVARRGLCSCLHSDNGTNFVAAAKHLKDVCNFFNENDVTITNGCASRSIEWKNIPATAASMGGLWEAGIKSAKHHLLRAVGDKALTFEELTTVFCKIEAVMNSRPLCPLSNNPDEFETLSPGHFLIGQSLVAVPEYSLEEVAMNRLSRWQCMQKISQTFWKKWSDDYLHTLQQRAKWFTSPPNIKIDDLVLIKSDLTRPLNWVRARVERLHEGPDKIIRVVTLRTQKGIVKRPVNKVCPFPYYN